MYSLTAVENVSLDGVMQAPGRPDEDTRNGFTLGGWAAERLAGDPEAAQAAMGGRFPPAAMLFGMRTYQDLLGHWLSTSEPNPFAQVLADTPKYVTSRSDQKDLSYPNSTLLAGEAADTVRELKQRGDDGELLVLGSGALVRDLVDADLVDRFVLTTIPVVLGAGFRLFDGVQIDLEVESSTTTPTGVVVACYRVVRD